MSFKCKECGQQQEAGSQPVTVVIEWRERRYQSTRDNVLRETIGREAVREIKCCRTCANRLEVATEANAVTDTSAPLSSNAIGQELVAMMDKAGPQSDQPAPPTAKRQRRVKASQTGEA